MEQQWQNNPRILRRWRQVSVRLLLVMGALFTAVPTFTLAAREPSNRAPTNANAFVQPNRSVGRFVNLNQAIRIAQEESGGQILSAKSVRAADGSQRHRIRVLVDGQRVTTMEVDQGGRVLRRR